MDGRGDRTSERVGCVYRPVLRSTSFGEGESGVRPPEIYTRGVTGVVGGVSDVGERVHCTTPHVEGTRRKGRVRMKGDGVTTEDLVKGFILWTLVWVLFFLCL